jgi:hypothetical protein
MKVFLVIFLAAAIFLGFIGLYFLLKPTELPSLSAQTSPTQIPTISKLPIDENVEKNSKLQAETNALLPFFNNMPQVPVYLKDEIINKEGSNTERGVAYTICDNQNQPIIFVKKVFYRKNNRKQIKNILKHELTHAWQCRQGIMWGHGEDFQKKFKEVGGFGN